MSARPASGHSQSRTLQMQVRPAGRQSVPESRPQELGTSSVSVGSRSVEHMFDQQTQTQPEGTDVLSAAGVLEFARARRREADAAEVQLLVAACWWADAHPPESIHDAASFSLPGLEHQEQIAGEGCP